MAIDLDKYAADYLAQYDGQHFETVLAAVRRRHVLESVSRYPHRSVLEIGCGLEPLFPLLDDYDEYWIVEPIPECADGARQNPAASTRLHVLDGFFEDVHEAAPRDFDFIVVSSLLHEVSDPVRLLTSLRQHCDADSVLHFNVPNVRSFHRLLALEAGLIEDLFEQSNTEKRFQRHTRFDKGTLFQLLEEHGFRIVGSGTYFIKPFTHSQMESVLKHGIVDMRIIDALDRMTTHLPDLGCEIFAEVMVTR